MSKRVAVLTVLALVVGASAGAAQQSARPVPTVVLPAELDRVLRDYERLWAAGDAAGLAAIFAPDGMALSSGRPPAVGRAAIAEEYKVAGGPLRLRAIAFAVSDSVGYIVGLYHYGNVAEDTGKFVLALRRAGVSPWLIAADIDNSMRRPGADSPP